MPDARIPDALRLALGTLTILRVPPPRRVDRAVGRHAMLLAPAVGILLGLVACAALDSVRWLGSHHNPLDPDSTYGTGARSVAVDLLAVVLAFLLLAFLTRALHLDGLVDTADGLGVKASGDGAATLRLAVMREPAVGAFGTIAVTLVLLVQIAALLVCVVAGHGTVGLLVAVVTGRLAATWACREAVPGARADGLGAAVAGSVPIWSALVVTVAVLAGGAALGAFDDDATVRLSLTLMAAVLVGLIAAWVLVRHCVRAFGGITGDVLGAAVEVATAAALVATALIG